MFTHAKTSKGTSKPFDITMYSDSIQFQSPNWLTLTGLLCDISQVITHTMGQYLSLFLLKFYQFSCHDHILILLHAVHPVQLKKCSNVHR